MHSIYELDRNTRIGRARFAWAVLLVCVASPAWGLNIVLDYTHDTYIQTNPAAMAAIEAAADNIEAVITSELPERFDANSVTIGKATASMDWEIRYTNPATNAEIVIDPVSIPADEFRVFVGVRPITQPGDPTPLLGRGGASSISVTNGFSIEPIFVSEIPQAISDLGAAVAQLETEANANAGRGGVGPTLGTFSDLDFSGSIAGTDFSFTASVSYGVGVGNLWFDVDTDDDGTIDDGSTLDDYWHWNHTTEPAGGKVDFYSVALHELLHTLGVGSSESWDSLINPEDPGEWLGSSLIAELGGSGEDAIDIESGAHLAEDISGVVFGGSASQEAAMDPNVNGSSRKFLTNLDVVVLDDINWDIVETPVLAGDYNDDGVVDAADYTVWRDNLGAAADTLPNDISGGEIDHDQYLAWQSNFGATLPPATPLGTTVPEPAGASLLMLAGIAFLRRGLRN